MREMMDGLDYREGVFSSVSGVRNIGEPMMTWGQITFYDDFEKLQVGQEIDLYVGGDQWIRGYYTQYQDRLGQVEEYGWISLLSPEHWKTGAFCGLVNGMRLRAYWRYREVKLVNRQWILASEHEAYRQYMSIG